MVLTTPKSAKNIKILLGLLLMIILNSCNNTNKVESKQTVISIEETPPIPPQNQQILDYVAQHGYDIAPTYYTAVCTEFVVKVIEHFTPLTKLDKKRINIVTNQDIGKLREQQSPIIKGVQYALVAANKGTAINDLKEVRPGDFFQMWFNTDKTYNIGHCGIVKEINLTTNQIIIYSSDPSTNGFGKMVLTIPNQCYFVRMN